MEERGGELQLPEQDTTAELKEVDAPACDVLPEPAQGVAEKRANEDATPDAPDAAAASDAPAQDPPPATSGVVSAGQQSSADRTEAANDQSADTARQTAANKATPTPDNSETQNSGDAQTEVLLRLQILDGSSTERRNDVRVQRTTSIGDLKASQFGEELAQGWRVRCLYMGRPLADHETVAQLPSGSFLQCYLQRSQAGAGVEPDMLPGWSRTSGQRIILPPPCSPWQDFTFHSIFALGLAAAWAAYFMDPRSFDVFSAFALRFFSLLWVVVCSMDLCCRESSEFVILERGHRAT